MTTKRNKAFASLDLILPVAPHYRTDPQVIKDIETMRTNAASRWVKDDSMNVSSSAVRAINNSSKFSVLARPKVELLRANSPTLKRLLAVRAKLEKYANSIARTISTSRQSIRSVRDTPYPRNQESSSTTYLQEARAPSQSYGTVSTSLPQTSQPPPQVPIPTLPSYSNKPAKPSTGSNRVPLDKITYQRTLSQNGNMKQKCSLEIWLPKPDFDDDNDDTDVDENNTINNMNPNNTILDTSHTIIPEMNVNEKVTDLAPIFKSRRSSVVKITATSTIIDTDTKAVVDDASSKKTESVVVPRVYVYDNYIIDLPDERPRSSKSVTTVKSEGTASIKSIRRQSTRPQTGRHSISTNQSEEILRFGTVEVPQVEQTSLVGRKSVTTVRETKPALKNHNPLMINELMQKYSLMKKNHQELTQAKLQLEKPNSDAKSTASRDRSPKHRPPPIPEPTLLISSEHPTVSVKKLLIETTSASRSAADHNNTNMKLLDRRSTPRQQYNQDNYPQLKIFSMANQHQQQQQNHPLLASTVASHLPTVSGKRTDETLRTLQRSKTVDVILDVPNPMKSTARVSSQKRLSHQ